MDIQCLSHEGSLGDACILAAASALADVKLPATAVDKDEEVIILPGKARQYFIVRPNAARMLSYRFLFT